MIREAGNEMTGKLVIQRSIDDFEHRTADLTKARTWNQNLRTNMSPASNAESSSSVFQVDIFWLRMTPCLLSILFLLLFVCSVMSVTEPAGCKIRFTDKGLDMCKYVDTSL